MIASLGPYEFTLGGILILAFLIASVIWFGRNDRNRKVRIGFFMERENKVADGILDDAPPEVKAWLARFFEEYPPPWRKPEGGDLDP